MSASKETIKLWWRPQVPNPQKVVIILEELGLPYKGEYIDLPDLYRPPFQPEVNPNGKIPAIFDPALGVPLWESSAIIQYLIETYDRDGKISYRDGPEKFQTLAWQQLQATGQGPYYGQAAWFNMFHPEKLESAQARYAKEVNRVLAVLDAHLATHDYLVGDKCTFADLSYVPWHASIAVWMGARPKDEWELSKYPNYQRWHDRMMARASVQKAIAMQKEEDVHH